MLVHWYIGMLVHWYIGTLVYWYIGTLVYWYVGILVHWYIGTSAFILLYALSLLLAAADAITVLCLAANTSSCNCLIC